MSEKVVKRKRINPLSDVAFKKVFEDKTRLKSLLNSILKYDVEDVFLTSGEQLPESKGDKKSILDIKAVTKNGEKINVEVQIINQYNIEERSLYYLSKMYASELREGQNYKEIKKAIAINILDFNLSDLSNKYHSRFLVMNEETHQVLTDKFQIHFIELPKFVDYSNGLDLDDQLQRWLVFLKEDDENLLEEVYAMDDVIKTAEKELDYYELSESLKNAYDNEMKRINDYVTNMEGSREEGLKEGLKEGMKEGFKKGEKEGLLAAARKMKENGYKDEDIKSVTGFDSEDLN